ncbi:MAG: DNA-binding response regulator [Acidimicrobiales bacterium]
MIVAAFVPDLMDRSRLRSVVDLFVPTITALAEVVADVVVIDLGRPGALDAVIDLAPRLRVVGFGSHVDTELLAAARQAGAEVLPRSRFFANPAAALQTD